MADRFGQSQNSTKQTVYDRATGSVFGAVLSATQNDLAALLELNRIAEAEAGTEAEYLEPPTNLLVCFVEWRGFSGNEIKSISNDVRGVMALSSDVLRSKGRVLREEPLTLVQSEWILQDAVNLFQIPERLIVKVMSEKVDSFEDAETRRVLGILKEHIRSTELPADLRSEADSQLVAGKKCGPAGADHFEETQIEETPLLLAPGKFTKVLVPFAMYLMAGIHNVTEHGVITVSRGMGTPAAVARASYDANRRSHFRYIIHRKQVSSAPPR
jgi:hypothetical protein